MHTNLPDSVHSALRDIVSTRVNTSWLRQLKSAPLYLSDSKAETVYVAMLQDSQLD